MIPVAGETAYGKFPFKSLDTMTTVARRTELSMLQYQVRRACCGLVGAPSVLWSAPCTAVHASHQSNRSVQV